MQVAIGRPLKPGVIAFADPEIDSRVYVYGKGFKPLGDFDSELGALQALGDEVRIFRGAQFGVGDH